jgi:hypothetical protein
VLVERKNSTQSHEGAKKTRAKRNLFFPTLRSKNKNGASREFFVGEGGYGQSSEACFVA